MTFQSSSCARVGAALLLGGIFPLAACRGGGAAIPCVGMGAPSDLVTRAASFRVDVYSTKAHCADAGGPSGATVFTQTFAAGGALSFDVASGMRPVVLTAFLDAQATQPLGRACTDADLGEGRKICLDLTLQLTADLDMGTMSCDPSNPSTCGALSCCDSVCRDVSADIKYCGGCRACAANQVATPACEGGLCQSTCQAGFGNCLQPVAPADDDGCETNLDTTKASCGACARACATTNTNAVSCVAGLCTSTCAAGFGNCTQPVAPSADDGCETATSTTSAHCGGCGRACSMTHVQAASCVGGACAPTCASGFVDCTHPAAPAADNGCECAGTACCPGNICQVQHTNGTGQNFFDCVALGTHDATEATAARAAYPNATLDLGAQTCGDGTQALCRRTLTSCACWGYDTGTVTPGSGHVNVNANPVSCTCPVAGDPAWN